MGKGYCKLTVFFDEPFWVGVFEKNENGKLSVSKITFGAEPKDSEIYSFILKHYDDLHFSPAVEAAVKESKKNPKRIQREVKKQLSQTGIATKSQQALQMQHEQFKTQHKQKSREEKKAQEKRLFELKQQKKKDKHRGR
ncbi:MAG: YjdF family protein [Acutalibacteraceae bacterium]